MTTSIPASISALPFSRRATAPMILPVAATPAADVSSVTILGQVAGDPFKIQNLVGGTCEELSS
jgi:hypothetical protein